MFLMLEGKNKKLAKKNKFKALIKMGRPAGNVLRKMLQKMSFIKQNRFKTFSLCFVEFMF